jgi:hypothetical protein
LSLLLATDFSVARDLSGDIGFFGEASTRRMEAHRGVQMIRFRGVLDREDPSEDIGPGHG